MTGFEPLTLESEVTAIPTEQQPLTKRTENMFASISNRMWTGMVKKQCFNRALRHRQDLIPSVLNTVKY